MYFCNINGQRQFDIKTENKYLSTSGLVEKVRMRGRDMRGEMNRRN